MALFAPVPPFISRSEDLLWWFTWCSRSWCLRFGFCEKKISQFFQIFSHERNWPKKSWAILQNFISWMITFKFFKTEAIWHLLICQNWCFGQFYYSRIPCLTPSNVLPFYVTAETGSVQCPGFAVLSTLLLCKPGLDQPHAHCVQASLVFYALCIDALIWKHFIFGLFYVVNRVTLSPPSRLFV